MVPRVNTRVWRVLSRRTREGDLSMQKAQTLVNKGLIPLVQALVGLKEAKDQKNLRHVLDAFQLLALGSYNMSTGRRAAMVNDLQGPYKPLCATGKPFTDLLFGDEEEFDKTLKAIKDVQQATSLGYTPSRGAYRGRGPSTRGRGQAGRGQTARGKGQGPFLGHKASTYKRRGGQHQQQRQRGQAAQPQMQAEPQQ